MAINEIKAVAGTRSKVTTPAINYIQDENQMLVIKGVDLPEYYEVEFCNVGDQETVTMVGDESGVMIPDQFLTTGKDVKAYLVLTEGESVQTRLEITIPVNYRPLRTDVSPTPAEQQQIDALVEAMNSAVAAAEESAGEAQDAADRAEASAEEAEQIATEAVLDAEAYAAGTRDGVPVTSGDVAYENNAKYYAEEAAGCVTAAGAAQAAAVVAQGKAEDAQAAAEAAQGEAETAQAAAEDAAEDAETQADNAAGSATAAAGSATAAAGSATAAAGSAATAGTRAAAAVASAEAAGVAQTAAETAQEKAEYAQAVAEEAQGKAETAEAGAEVAREAAETAQGKAEDAQTGAETAQGKAEDAQDAAETAQAAAEAAAESIEESAEQIAQNTSDIADLDDDVSELKNATNDLALSKAPVITDTATGTIASFPDGADALPLKKLVAQIEPVQDLHGQDSPYPPGGGKNKLNSTETITVEPITFNADSDYYITASPNNTDPRPWTYNNSQWFLTLPAGNYKISWEVKTPSTSSSQGIRVYDSEENLIANSVTPLTFTRNGYIDFTLSEEESIGVITKIYDGAVRFMVCNADAPNPTVFAPYSNICPISGWTGMNGQRTGKNLLPNDLTDTTIRGITYTVNSDGSITANGTATSWATVKFANNFHLKAGTYLFSSSTSSRHPYWVLKDAKDRTVKATVQSSTVTVTLEEGDYYGEITVAPNTVIDNVTIYPMICLASDSDSTYAPYNAETLSVSWQDTAGTVYGGTMTVNEDGSGTLVSEYGDVDLGALAWGAETAGFYSEPITGIITGNYDESDLRCSAFMSSGPATKADMPDNSIRRNSVDDRRAFVKTSLYQDAATFKTSMSGQQLLYKLATPLTYNFDNLGQLTTVLGTNNIFVDCGQATAEYRADTKLYIDKKLAALVAALS